MVGFNFGSYRLLQREDRTTLTREDLLIQGISQAIRLGQVDE
jgi:hypothetical protein